MITTLKQNTNSENISHDLKRLLNDGIKPFATKQNAVNKAHFNFNQIPLQAKLKMNAPNDRYEQEADRIADKVMNMNAAISVDEESYNQINRKPLLAEISRINTTPAQRTCASCEEEEGEIVQRKTSNNIAPISEEKISRQLNETRGSGGSIDFETNQFMSSRFGMDFSSVNIHDNSKAAQMSQSINARAFTIGNDIYFNKGEYNPASTFGKRLLAHELVHTVQQKGNEKLVQKSTKEVDISNNNRTCKAKRDYKIIDKSLSPNLKFDADSTNIRLNIKWCKGKNSGDITIGANVPQQASNVATDIIDVIRKGGGASQIEEKLRNTDLTPFINVVIKQGGAFSLTAQGEITVNSDKVLGGKGSLDLNLGPVIFSPNIEVKDGSDFKAGLDIKIPFGGGKVDKVKCKTQKIQIGQILDCECPTPAKKIPSTLEVPILPETKFLYFDYNSANISKEHSEKSISEIKRLLGFGYRVKTINGFTSPEGTTDSSPGFEGNKDLAEKRADATRTLIGEICSPFKMRDAVKCDSNILKNIKQLNVGELHSSNTKGALLKDEYGKELEGKKLAEHAIRSFGKSKKEQQHLGVLNEKERKGLEKAETAQQKAKFIYPLLRRVEINLVKSGKRKIPIEIKVPPGKEPCPPEVLKKAKEKLPKMPL